MARPRERRSPPPGGGEEVPHAIGVQLAVDAALVVTDRAECSPGRPEDRLPGAGVKRCGASQHPVEVEQPRGGAEAARPERVGWRMAGRLPLAAVHADRSCHPWRRRALTGSHAAAGPARTSPAGCDSTKITPRDRADRQSRHAWAAAPCLIERSATGLAAPICSRSAGLIATTRTTSRTIFRVPYRSRAFPDVLVRRPFPPVFPVNPERG